MANFFQNLCSSQNIFEIERTSLFFLKLGILNLIFLLILFYYILILFVFFIYIFSRNRKNGEQIALIFKKILFKKILSKFIRRK